MAPPGGLGGGSCPHHPAACSVATESRETAACCNIEHLHQLLLLLGRRVRVVQRRIHSRNLLFLRRLQISEGLAERGEVVACKIIRGSGYTLGVGSSKAE